MLNVDIIFTMAFKGSYYWPHFTEKEINSERMKPMQVTPPLNEERNIQMWDH